MVVAAAVLLGANIFHFPKTLEHATEARKALEHARGEELRVYGWPLTAANEKLTVVTWLDSPEGIVDVVKSLEWNFVSLAVNVVLGLVLVLGIGILMERLLKRRNTPS